MSALLALSDALVIRALERCSSRGLSGDARKAAMCRTARHRVYEIAPIPAMKHTYALSEAWVMTDELVDRWLLPVQPGDWARVLDDYVRYLLTTMTPHNLDDLQRALALLGAGHAV